jgi:hypothetical protein
MTFYNGTIFRFVSGGGGVVVIRLHVRDVEAHPAQFAHGAIESGLQFTVVLLHFIREAVFPKT